MALNYRGTGAKITVTAAAGRTGGIPVVENNLAGIPQNTVLTGQKYPLAIEGVYDIAFIASSVIGDIVCINDTTNALTRIAYDATVAVGTRPLGTVVAVPGAGIKEPKSGRMHIKLLPQAIATP